MGNYKFYKGVNELSILEQAHLNNFFLSYHQFCSIGLIKPIFRGDSLRSLCELLDIDMEFQGIEQLSERLFMLGSKARHYFSKDYFEKKGHSFAISDCSNKVIEYVFGQVYKTVTNNRAVNVKFYSKNQDFCNYFQKNSNKKDFVEKFDRLNENDKLAARNYYLKLVHQFATAGYKTKSHVISTTSSYRIANQFAKGKDKDSAIVLHAWECDHETKKSILNKAQLPAYAGTPYRQSELSLIGGILPHYIIGLELKKSKIFLVNPHLFYTKITKKLFRDGFDVDQRRFFEVFEQTRYEKSYVRINGSLIDIG